ncbi:energy transducer TonB [Luteitalea sp. TBR-22]|uniref:energy transducer TonB n=1 Tax=Luteitalea sp. TBR-22 TaxID=2802971 RepID=UPI001EF40614|nr:energy transducer TonB [Luteitalea sp. TBR-22]
MTAFLRDVALAALVTLPGVAAVASPGAQPQATQAGPGPLEQVATRPGPDVALPRVVSHVAPAWPPGTTGAVRLRVNLVIDAEGRVAEARVTTPTSLLPRDPSEVAAVLAAVRQWRFEPPSTAPLLLSTYVGTSDDDGVVVPSGRSRPPLRVGGVVGPPTKIRHVPPTYPAEALSAGISGVVILEITVDPDGAVVDARPVRSMPGLDAAAIDSVKQWRYAPTWLNGEPVSIVLTVTVNFQP